MRGARVKGIRKLLRKAVDLRRRGRMFLLPGRLAGTAEPSPVDPRLFFLGGIVERRARRWTAGLLRSFAARGVTLRHLLEAPSIGRGEIGHFRPVAWEFVPGVDGSLLGGGEGDGQAAATGRGRR